MFVVCYYDNKIRLLLVFIELGKKYFVQKLYCHIWKNFSFEHRSYYSKCQNCTFSKIWRIVNGTLGLPNKLRDRHWIQRARESFAQTHGNTEQNGQPNSPLACKHIDPIITNFCKFILLYIQIIPVRRQGGSLVLYKSQLCIFQIPQWLTN
jgi:hypothetical protein